MNPPTSSEIIDLATRVRSLQPRLLRLFDELDSSAAAVASATAQIAEIGNPSLKDEAAVGRLAVAQTKLNLSQARQSELAAEIAKVCGEEVVPALDQGGKIVRRLLWNPLNEKCQAVAAAIRPWCDSDDEAKSLALQTAAARGWVRKIDAISSVYKIVAENRSRQVVMDALNAIDVPCQESFRTVPNLTKLLD